MHILLTGSNFITRNFEEKFSKKWELSYLTEEQLSDVSKVSAAFRKNQFDVVLHLAHKSSEGLDAAQNLIYFRNLQYGCTLGKVSRLFFCIVGEDREGEVVNANEPDLERSKGGGSLGAATRLICELAKKDKFTSVLRLGVVYGKYQKAEDNLIMTAVNAIYATKKPKKITIPYDRKLTMTYVDDTVKLLGKLISENKPRGTYNVVSGENPLLSDIAKNFMKAAQKAGREIEIEVGQKLAPEYTLSNSRIQVFFSDNDYVSSRSGIGKLIKMYGEDSSLLQIGL